MGIPSSVTVLLGVTSSVAMSLVRGVSRFHSSVQTPGLPPHWFPCNPILVFLSSSHKYSSYWLDTDLKTHEDAHPDWIVHYNKATEKKRCLWAQKPSSVDASSPISIQHILSDVLSRTAVLGGCSSHQEGFMWTPQLPNSFLQFAAHDQSCATPLLTSFV